MTVIVLVVQLESKSWKSQHLDCNYLLSTLALSIIPSFSFLPVPAQSEILSLFIPHNEFLVFSQDQLGVVSPLCRFGRKSGSLFFKPSIMESFQHKPKWREEYNNLPSSQHPASILVSIFSISILQTYLQLTILYLVLPSPSFQRSWYYQSLSFLEFLQYKLGCFLCFVSLHNHLRILLVQFCQCSFTFISALLGFYPCSPPCLVSSPH